ncbi:MAG: cation:proton antiporter [Acidimicrobiia bacterium]|jgi:NhaP-type Na+/H+ or K+/H+ antiporter|nr:cation:proton antiporter [Acidimicrobiia bacterium]
MDVYDLGLAAAGAALLGAAVVPLILAGRPLSFPIIYIALGALLFAVAPGVRSPDPIGDGQLAERLSELAVVVSLMGAGLKLDRRVGWRSWRITWRLLGIAMPITIAAAALLGWWVVGFAPATALLLGAALAPTDPVLASDVQVGPPGDDEEDDVRFALTSEAGLNDGLAFPFTLAAIAAATGAVGEWAGGWFLDAVLLRLGVGLALGYAAGRALGWVVFRIPSERKLAESTEGFVALAGTLLTYGVTELAHGYGFIAVFVAACVLRDHERGHDYHDVLHSSAESIERLLSALLLILIGGSLVGGVLGPLGWEGVVVGLLLLLVVRPLAGLVSLAGTGLPPGERVAIAFLGIRGVGSIFYIAYALEEEAAFGTGERLWALVVFVIVGSAVLHGLTSNRVMRRLDEGRQPEAEPVT